MNYEENRAFLDEFRGSKQAQIIEDDEDSSSTPSSDAPTQPPTPQPQPPQSPPPSPERPETPDSSASTVSPSRSPPLSPSVSFQCRPSHSYEPRESRPSSKRAHSRQPAQSYTVRRERTPSSVSSASTVPPPSPGALNRVNNSTTPRIVKVSVDAGGIEDLKDEDTSAASDKEYPRLRKLPFVPDEDVGNELLLSNRGAKPPNGVLPARITSFLSPFQRDGVTFLYRLYERGRGGLLADSMGLGKTVQTICFLGAVFGVWDRASRKEERTPKVLVVAPISVRDNWQREFEKWTPFRIMLYERNEEPEITRKLREGTIDVVISGDNPVASRAKSFFAKPLGDGVKWEWDVVIVDEVHIAKNKNTKIFKGLKSLPTGVMFGLTGTAVQNRLNELWNVMSLVVPETLWPSYKSFKADYTNIITKGTKRDASEYMRRKAQERIGMLRKLLSKHMIRRPKSVIDAQLPGKTDYCVLMRMKRDGLQGYMYQRFQNSYDVKLLRDALLPCDCGSKATSKECCHRFPITKENLSNAPIWEMTHEDGPCERCPNCISFHLQHVARWLAAHALLVLPEPQETDREKALARKKVFMYYLGDRASLANEPVYSLERDAILSCKLNVALKLLRAYESNGNKTIIFYESLRLGEILRRWAENNGLRHEVIDGSVTKGRRQRAVDRFNSESGISTFFISKRAGGTGLNIYGADRVLIFEPCYNPSLDLQAGDRAYRLGQKRVVHIIRLVVENTIEHYVFKTALTKSQVSSAILDNTNEQWLIRENEVGSMHAMLSMGDVFERDSAKPDDFRVLEAEQLKEKRRKDGVDSESDSTPDDVQDEPDSLREDCSPDIDGLLGEDDMCSLDVDVDEGLMSLADGENLGKATRDFVPAESQFEMDRLLGEGGASKKLVMHSTSARKRKRQMMGVNDDKRPSGINPDGASNINFDDADLENLSVSMNTREEGEKDSWEKPVIKKRPRRKGAKRGVDAYLDGNKSPLSTRVEQDSDSWEERVRQTRSRQSRTVVIRDNAGKQKEPVSRRITEEVSADSEDEVSIRGNSRQPDPVPQEDVARRQGNANRPRSIIERQRKTNAMKKITTVRSIAKNPKQKKPDPKSAFAARARVRR